MKTKISRIGKKSLSVIIALMMIVSTMLVGMVSASAVGAYDNGKFKKDDKIYFNFSATGATEVNVLDSGYPVKDYYNNSEFSALTNKTVECTLTKDLDLSKFTARLYGLNNSGWKHYNNNTSILPSDGQNMVVISADGKSYTWSTYSGSSPTQSAVNFGKGGTGSGTVTAKAGTTTLESGNKVNNNTSVTFTATAGANSTFDGWYSTQDCSGTAVSTDNPYTKTVTAITNVYAKFTSTATPTTQYYIGGRFKTSTTDTFTGAGYEWNADSENVPFVETETTGIYKVETGLTVADLSGQTSGKQDYFFLITAKSGTTTSYYGDSNKSGTYHNFQKYINSSSSASLGIVSGDDAKRLIKFSDTNATTGLVTIFLDTNGGMKLWYTTDGTSTRGDFNIIDKTAANGKLTFSAPNKAAGTADAGNTVTITGTPLNSYYELSNVSVSYKVGKTEVPLVASKTDGKFTFDIPSDLDYTTVKDATISVKGTFTLTSSGKLDYVIAQGAGLYIDVAPTKEDTTATLIKWNNYQGSNHGTSNPYTFYVPKNVDLANAVIYNTTGNSVTIGGQTINNNDKAEGVKLTKGNNTITNCSITDKVVVMQGSTDAMFLNTTKEDGTDFDLPTARKWQGDNGITDKKASEYKATIKSSGGSCTTMDNTSGTAKFSSAMGLDTVKGRGNSSWKASATMFGKYAFNMKLSSKTSLLGMDSAKSWCLLANNADESMMRNALIYQLAKEIGLPDSPEFRFVDIYDNGEYMGSYLVTEKVDVGSSKLVKGKSFEDLNEDAVKAQGGTEIDETLSKGATYSFTDSKGNTHSNLSMRYATVGKNTGSSPFEYNTTGKYLLEFEISERVNDEPCYFVSPHGQNVVVKNPEFATKEQVEFIAAKFAEMEDIAFTTGATKAQLSTVMDVESFAKMYLIQEFSSNLDSASTSYYITFDCAQTNPVFVANPVWDYDWTCGQYNNQVGKKVDVDGTQLDTTGTNSWVAKNKAMDDSKNKDKGRSLQSQLAGTNVAFKSVVRKVWEETNGFYDKIQQYYSADGQITKWKDKISSSVNMNETRWGFIKDNLLTSWGTNDTGDTFDGEKSTVTALNTWVTNRATWLNKQFTDNSEYTPFTPAAPASTVTDVNGTVKSSFEVGESFLINVTTVEDGVTYSVYHGDTNVGENVENGKIQIVATAEMVGEQTFTVKATYGSKTVTSNVIVTVNASSDVKNITVYFKTATAPAYAPSVSFDDGNATAMTKSSDLGKDYSGALTFAWYSVEIQNVDTTKTHTLTFTSKRTKLNATWNGTLTKDSYFTADNLMNGTVAVNLTDKGEAERNFFYSATNMVYDSTDAKNKTLGFTFVGNARVKMGTVVNDSNGTVTPVSAPTVKSATYIQMLNASMITVSSLQSELYDVNFDGKVDVKDATYIQYALAS